jgi:hypothetical protein
MSKGGIKKRKKSGMRFHQSARVGGKINKKSNISKRKLFIIFIFAVPDEGPSLVRKFAQYI